jgi:D-glycero-D-manno-heptose 1,7-bisphosphate phosphatase
MLIRAAHRLEIDLRLSYMVGDKISDMEAGAAAGCSTILVNPDPVWCPQADFQADSAAAALDLILKKGDQGERV